MMIIKRKKNGMSLVEIMGAIFVLSFAILAVASIFPAGLQMNRKTKIRIQALELASGIAEEIRQLPYYDYSNNPGVNNSLLDIANTGTTSTDGWDGFTTSANGANQGGAKAWTPNILLQTVGTKNDVFSERSPIFFRNGSNEDTRRNTPVTFTQMAPVQVPAIQIKPLIDSGGNIRCFYTYGGVSRCRIHKIIVTANIEESSVGRMKYSIIQVITYKSDGITSLGE
ncbi:MAG: prepilin-type N-terminal cleavage/methylation domain-containing protein [Candidatus Eremiobacterota bacterium]